MSDEFTLIERLERQMHTAHSFGMPTYRISLDAPIAFTSETVTPTVILQTLAVLCEGVAELLKQKEAER